jgi:AhpC/TSA family
MSEKQNDQTRAIDSSVPVSVDALDTSTLPFCADKGDMAPSFHAHAYHQGKHIKIDSKQFLGKWLVLFFYPSDFTFV